MLLVFISLVSAEPPTIISCDPKCSDHFHYQGRVHKRAQVVGFLRVPGCSRGGGNSGTLRIPMEDWGTLGNIREY